MALKGRSPMNITQVFYAVEISKYRSFSEAAQHLFVSQPALSQQIRALEQELEYEIFVRSPQGIRVTPEGKQFLALAAPLMDSWEDFRQHIYTLTPHRRQLRIGMGSRVYSNGLFDDIAHFFEEHSEVEVTFFTEAGLDFVTMLKNGSLDLALDRLPPERLLETENALASYKLIREQQCVLMAPTDRLAGRDSLRFVDLQDCTMMTGLQGSIEDKSLRETCRAHGITLSRLYRSDGIDTVIKLVRSGKGVILGPRSFADYYNVAAVPLDPPEDVYLEFICLGKNAMRPDILMFRRFMEELCKGKTE